ncbi:PilN domain-containing protein [Motiliproteus sp. SC1-56]|uniref:PilN domain-containing protein n=1 Tax=Motiliproteus sp. SC1-56 TaxID=2799565 RepID=UPI001A8F5F00|nr:PilN domain-containing protein [Motiliproteus sp. SC1-56]
MVGLREVGGRLRRFGVWWRNELIGLMPDWMRLGAPFGQSSAWLVLDERDIRLVQLGTKPCPQAPSLTHPDGDKARQQVTPLKRVLLLPPERVLRRRVALPLAVENNLPDVIRYELDRLTPYREDQVYYAYRVMERDVVGQQIHLELLLCPRADLDPWLEELNSHGLGPAQITLREADGDAILDVNLLPKAQRPRAWRIPQLINSALLVVALVLLGLWLLLPLYQLNAQVKALEPQLEAAHAEAKEAQALRKKLEQLGDDISYLAQKHRGEVKKLDILHELTLILPDDTWIQQLQIQGKEVLLQGESSAAATVVQLLEGSPLLHRVRFRSPVVRVAGTDADTDTERFHLSAELRQESEG